ncbi:MAG: hypothetical protein J6O73_02755 [Lachnospiraceae bacterium]|nr:hypothetical protein [Lachnospiraceae bacterium]
MNQTGSGEEKNFRYLVLATGTLKQVQIAKALSERFPKEQGRIFLPEREYWIRKTKSIGKKPLFSGYLFAQTDMSQKELYLFVKENSRDILTYVNEVSVKGMKDSGAQITDEIWNELTKEESALADCKAAVGDAADCFILSKCQFFRRIQGERKMIEKVAFPGYFFY